jgi:F-type H+-transporting ATPase subunit b
MLGISLAGLISQLVNFFILFGLLYLVAYKPVMRMLDERSRRIKESMEQAEALKKQNTEAEVMVKKQLQTASEQGQGIVDRAVKSGEEIKLKAQQDAKQEAEAILVKARQEIRAERDEALQEARQQLADLTIMAASKVVGKSLDEAGHRRLVEKALEEASNSEQG